MKIFDRLRAKMAARRAENDALAAYEAAGFRWYETPTPERVVEMRRFQAADAQTTELKIITVEHLDERGYPPLTRELAQAMDAEDEGGPKVHIVHVGADEAWADELKAVRLDIDAFPNLGVSEITSDELSEWEIELAREDAEWAALWLAFDERQANRVAELESKLAGWASKTEVGRLRMYRMFSDLRVRDARFAAAAEQVAVATLTRPITPTPSPHPGNNTHPKRLRHRRRRQEWNQDWSERIAA